MAEEIEQKVQAFFASFTGYLNQQDSDGIIAFLRSNSDDAAVIRKKIIKINSASTEANNFKIEEFEMDLNQYKYFLDEFFGRVYKYAVNHKLTSYEYNAQDDTIIASVEYTEYAVIRKRDPDTNTLIEEPVYINANCSYSFSNTSGLPRIYYNTCIEKVVHNE